jgi:hypothetical protein
LVLGLRMNGRAPPHRRRAAACPRHPHNPLKCKWLPINHAKVDLSPESSSLIRVLKKPGCRGQAAARRWRGGARFNEGALKKVQYFIGKIL